jgi:hypothetical protein
MGSDERLAAAKAVYDKYKLTKKMKLSPKYQHDYKEYYLGQTIHDLNESDKPHDVPIWYNDRDIPSRRDVCKVDSDWSAKIDAAIKLINEAAPGLHLHRIFDEKKASILIYCLMDRTPQDSQAYTIGNIHERKQAYVYFGNKWLVDDREGTAVHEIFHALGFHHEHQRRFASEHVDISGCNINPNWRPQYEEGKDKIGITRFDPFSIMMYDEGCQMKRKDNVADDDVWSLKPGIERNTKMSELDKVGLNIVYKPCIREGIYNPVLSSQYGLYTCGRKVMQSHNHPDPPIVIGGKCGSKGINCPACRTLKTEKFTEMKSLNKWQGWSGMVYCGCVRMEGQNCGPDQGENCTDCENFFD